MNKLEEDTKYLREHTSKELSIVPAFLDDLKDIILIEERVLLNEIILNLITPKKISNRVIDISVKRFNNIIDSVSDISRPNSLLQLVVNYEEVLEYICQWALDLECFEVITNIKAFHKKLYEPTIKKEKENG